MITEKLSLQSENGLTNFFDSEYGDKFISGIAINPGKYHGLIRIEEDEMQNAVDTIKNTILLKDHENLCDNSIGRVTESDLLINEKTGQRCCGYTAWIDSDETKLINKIDKGIIDSCSIGFEYEPFCSICGRPLEECSHFIWDEGFEILAKNINIHELSIVAVPADSNATVESFKLEDTLSNKLIELKKQKRQQGEYNMDFEEKYSELKAEFDAFKESAQTELEELKSEHETKISDRIEETLSVKAELKETQEALDAANSELETLKAEMAQITEQKLEGLRAEVSELNKKVSARLSEEEIAGLSESTLNRYIEMFSNIVEAQPSLKPETNANHQYTEVEELDEDASTLERLMFKKQNL